MKNKNMLLLISTAFLTLAACGTNVSPENLAKYNKVSRAFNAVQNTMKRKAASKNLIKNPNYAVDFNGGLSELEELFSNLPDSGESLADQIEYDTPPFIQFQYMKSIYDKIGSSYSFDTKYAYDLTGEVFIDMETGFKDESKDVINKYSYVFNLSVSINIDESDLIVAYVGMDITLNQGQKNYKSTRYVKMDLDYDFSKNDDNYEMALFDTANESDLKYLNIDRNYEYDYASVAAGDIIEWRKFRYELDRAATRDDSHQTLDDYINEGAVVATDNARWYKNGVMRRIDGKDAKSLDVAKISFDKLGLNPTDLGEQAYLAKSTTTSDVIRNIYQEICRTYGDDILYSIVGRNNDGGSGGDGGNTNKRWPENEIQSLIGFNLGCAIQEDANINFVFNRIDDNTCTVEMHNATASQIEEFKAGLLRQGFFQTGEIDTYMLASADGSVYAVSVRTINGVVMVAISHGGGQGQNKEAIELGFEVTYYGQYSRYQKTSYSFNKEVENDFARLISNIPSDYYANNIVPESSGKLEVFFDDGDEFGNDASAYANKSFNEFINNLWAAGWRSLDGAQNTFMLIGNDGDCLIKIDYKEDDKAFAIYYFQFNGDQVQRFVRGELPEGGQQGGQEVQKEAKVLIKYVNNEGTLLAEEEIPAYTGDSYSYFLYHNTVSYYFDMKRNQPVNIESQLDKEEVVIYAYCSNLLPDGVHVTIDYTYVDSKGNINNNTYSAMSGEEIFMHIQPSFYDNTTVVTDALGNKETLTQESRYIIRSNLRVVETANSSGQQQKEMAIMFVVIENGKTPVTTTYSGFVGTDLWLYIPHYGEAATYTVDGIKLTYEREYNLPDAPSITVIVQLPSSGQGGGSDKEDAQIYLYIGEENIYIIDCYIGDNIWDHIDYNEEYKYTMNGVELVYGQEYKVTDKNVRISAQLQVDPSSGQGGGQQENTPATIYILGINTNGELTGYEDSIAAKVGDSIWDYLQKGKAHFFDQSYQNAVPGEYTIENEELYIYIFDTSSQPSTSTIKVRIITVDKSNESVDINQIECTLGDNLWNYLDSEKVYYLDAGGKQQVTPTYHKVNENLKDVYTFINQNSGGQGGESGGANGGSDDENKVYYYLTGTINSWAEGDAAWMLTQDANDENHYYISGNNFAKGAEIKVVSSEGTWFGPDGTYDQSPNFEFSENGEYTIHFYVSVTGDGKHITAEKTGEYDYNPYEDNTYYVVGKINGVDDWEDITNGIKLVRNIAVEDTYEFYTRSYTRLTEGDIIKIAGSDGSWFPSDPNYTYTVKESGIYAIYFRPEGNGSWSNGYFEVVKIR